MEKIVLLSHEVHAEASAIAWFAVGVLILAGIVLCAMVLLWIFGGGLARSPQELLAQQRQIANWLRDDGHEQRMP